MHPGNPEHSTPSPLGEPEDYKILQLQKRLCELEKRNAELERALERPASTGTTKEAFLSNMSHELRTPLNGLLGMAEILRETELTREQREYLAAIKQCGHDLLRIVNNLLDISSAERGLLKLRPKVFPLRPTVEAIMRPLQEQARNKGVTLDLQLDPLLPDHLWGDAERLQQVLLNLTANAVKFTPSGRVEVIVQPWETLRRKEQEAVAGADAVFVCMLHVTVRDSGIGIPQEKHADIFEAFHLSEALLTKKYAGAGLGLPIAKHLVSLMGGELWFESTSGQGSCFQFTALFDVPFPERWNAKTAQNGQVQQPACVNLDVLLVEDEEVSRFLARTMLTRLGHNVTCAENGLQALEILRRKAFDLVLMDIQMPTMDGVTATRNIRDPGSVVLCHDVPIVALTVFAMQGDRERFLEAGMDEYLTKPVDKERLQRAITNALQRALVRSGNNGEERS